MLETQSLKSFGSLLKGVQRITFAKKCGSILDLLEVNVQVEGISALTQFYNPPMRYFTFQDFQLAPSLEEYERILGISMQDYKPYLYGGHYPSLNTVAKLLKAHERELEGRRLNRNDVDGFSRSYLMEMMKVLSEEKDWIAFMDVLALTIHEVVLCPHLDDYVDFSAIDVLLTRRDK